MRFQRSGARRPAQVSLTSMLDVIFLLLCFFITASVFSQWESEISITLPSAATADEPDRLPGEIVVNISKDGSVKVNGATFTREALGERLARIARFYPGQAVIIRADKDAKYDALVKVVDTCRAAGVWNFSLATAADGAKDAK